MRRFAVVGAMFALACADPATSPNNDIADHLSLQSSYGDTTLQLYLNPSQGLTAGTSSSFVHLRVLVRGTAIPASQVFARFSSSDSRIISLPHGAPLDDDRTRVYANAAGTARITAEWPVGKTIYRTSQDFVVPGATADTTVQLYLVPENTLTPGDNSVFVHARVLIRGTALPASQTFTSFVSANPAVLEVPFGGNADDDRTRLHPKANGSTRVTARWTANGKTYTGSRDFNVGSSAARDTTVQLYLVPEKTLTPGDNSVFVHARVLIGGTALPASQTLTSFVSANSGVLEVPFGAPADDDRTRLHPKANGTARVTARWTANGKTYTGSRDFSVSAASSAPPDGGTSPPPGSYSPTTPHWSHIRTRVTDFYYNWTSATRDTAARRFDLVLNGSRAEWSKRNPAVKQIQYRLHWTIMQPQQSGEYQRLLDWYRVNTQCNLEDAFLHRAGTSKTLENRISHTIWGSSRWIFNPSDECWRRWSRAELGRLVAAGCTGVFYDEYTSEHFNASRATSSLEHGNADSFYRALAAALAAERAAYPHGIIMLNTSEYMAGNEIRLIDAAGAVHLELFNDLLHGNMEHRWGFIEDRLASGVLVELIGRRNWRSALPGDVTPGNYRDATLDGFAARGMYRQKMGELASYYLVRPGDPRNFYFDTNNDNWKISPTAHWLRAQEVDVGDPRESRRRIVNTTGADGQRVSVWQRDYSRALILARPSVDWTTSGYGDASGYRVPLPSAMRLLRHDGTLGPLITEITLRKGEGAVLMKP